MSLGNWNIWDIFIIVTAFYFIIRGCFRGLVGELVTLAGFLASFYLSFHYSGEIGAILGKSMGLNPYVAQATAVVLIWLCVTLAAAVLRLLLKGLVGAVHLTAIDKLLGFFTGMLKTVIIIYVIIMGGLLLAPVVSPTWLSESTVLRYAGRNWPVVRSCFISLGVLPQDTTLPNGTLEQILRVYRKGGGGPKGYNPTPGRT